MRLRSALLFALALAGCDSHPLATRTAATAQPAEAIAWHPYADALKQARAENKPVLLVISAEWCPHCRNYKAVFKDPKVVAAAQKFVMVRIDEDREPQVAARYREDGAYVPRTYFLAPDGSIANVHAANPRYRYFYDERNPASILGGMSAALAATRAAD